MTDVVGVLAKTGLFYHSLMTSLLSIINEKDVHITALKDKLKESGGSYFPRRNKDSLGLFDKKKWRELQREGIPAETGWEVFERWGELGEEEILDWEGVAKGLEGWKRESEDSAKVCSLYWVNGQRKRDERVEDTSVAKRRKEPKKDDTDDEFAVLYPPSLIQDPSTVGKMKSTTSSKGKQLDTDDDFAVLPLKI
jgi:hypothetical protein